MSETMHRVHPGRGGTTDDDRRTAMRFVLGRPGWVVEARATAEGEACIRITTPRPGTNGQRFWSVTRTEQGLLVRDEASGQRLPALPTMRDVLMEIWEATSDVAVD